MIDNQYYNKLDRLNAAVLEMFFVFSLQSQPKVG